MKQVSILLVIAALFMGCAGFKVVAKNDQFKQSTVVTADMWHKVLDSTVDNQRVIYQKEIKNGKMTDATVSFQFCSYPGYWTGMLADDLKKDVYFQLDDKSFNLKFIDFTNDLKALQGSSSGGKGSGSRTYTVNIKNMSGTVKLTPDVEKAILACNVMKIRFYTGNDPLTLQATSAQLEAIKRFIAVNPANVENIKN